MDNQNMEGNSDSRESCEIKVIKMKHFSFLDLLKAFFQNNQAFCYFLKKNLLL